MMNKYSFNLAWSDEDEGFIATCPEFPGLTAFGETAEEALSEASVALSLFIETYKEDGISLPEPKTLHNYSGQFRLRLPKSLHGSLATRAESEGVSLNSLILSYLSQAVSAADVASQCNSRLNEVISEVKDSVAALVNSQRTVFEMAPRYSIDKWTGRLGASFSRHPLQSQITEWADSFQSSSYRPIAFLYSERQEKQTGLSSSFQEDLPGSIAQVFSQDALEILGMPSIRAKVKVNTQEIAISRNKPHKELNDSST
jgi:predicted RNase H-like HicB family nuclease